jgi:hypothetical protein
MTDSSVLVVNDTRVDRHYGCHAVISAIIALLESNNMRVTHFWPAHTDWRASPEFDLALAGVSLVVVNAEGTIHHDLPAGRRLLEIGAVARGRGIPVALINVGWEANGSDMVALLDDFDIVSARDARSAAQMSVCGANVRIVPDLSIWFALTRQPRVPADQLRSGVGFADNVKRLQAVELERLRKDCRGESLSIFQRSSGPFAQLQFLRNGVSFRQDLFHPERLAALILLRRQLWRRMDPNFSAFLHRLAGFELLVTGRFHSCTLALATGTPLVAQKSNTHKISSLFNDAGLESWRVDGTLDRASVERARAYGWSAAEKVAIDSYTKHAVVAAEALFTDVAKLPSQ